MVKQSPQARVAAVVKRHFAELTDEQIRWATGGITNGFRIGVKISGMTSDSNVRKHLAMMIKLERKLYDAVKSMPSELDHYLFGSMFMSNHGLAQVGVNCNALTPGYLSPRQLLCREVSRLGEIFSDTNRRVVVKRGRPDSEPASFVTEMAAMVFEELSGKTVTRAYNAYAEAGGQSTFERFLADVFSALDIEASVERQTRALMDKTRKK